MEKRGRWPTLGQMLALSNEELAAIDPVAMNLEVARGIPSLAELNIDYYVQLSNQWADDLRSQMPDLEKEFHQTPNHWDNDFDLFRLGLVCWYVDVVLEIGYREDQQKVSRINYTNPSDLFLNGVMETRAGSCASLAILHVVLGRRIGLPVFLACVGSHFLCRFDNGKKTINIEATETGRGGFSSKPDDYVLQKHQLPPVAQQCGSDLRAVSPREMLGIFVGLRARYLENTDRSAESERDYLLARYLFPRNRQLYICQNQTSIQCSLSMFEPHEKGHPHELSQWLQVLNSMPHRHIHLPSEHTLKKENLDGRNIDAVFQQIFIATDFG